MTEGWAAVVAPDDVDNHSILNATCGSCSRCTFVEPGGVREKSAGE